MGKYSAVEVAKDDDHESIAFKAMLILFYSSETNPFRASADHKVVIPLDLSPLAKRKHHWHSSLQVFQHWIALEIGYVFEVADDDISTTRVEFLDEDGDRILMDSSEAYREALKVAAKNQGTLRVLVNAPCKTSFSAKKMEEVGEIRHTSTDSSSSEGAAALTPSEPPSWLRDCIRQVKDELKQEIMESLHSSSNVSVAGGNTPTVPPPPPAPAAPPELKMTGRPSADDKNKWSEQRKKMTREVRKKYLDTKDSPLIKRDCDLCCRVLEDVYFVCLSKCAVVLCPECVHEGGHSTEHVMLRLPKEMKEKPKTLLTQAAVVLRGVRDVNKPKERAEKKFKKSRDPLKNITLDEIYGRTNPSKDEADAQAWGGWHHPHKEYKKIKKAMKKERKEEKKLAKWSLEALEVPQAQPPVLKKDYDIEVLEEMETRKMDGLSPQENHAAFWRRWTVLNCGRLPWDGNVQLVMTSACEGVTELGDTDLPHLQSGQRGEVVVWATGPVAGEGSRGATWQLQDKQAGTFFGPSFRCEWALEEKAEEGSDSAEYISGEDSDGDFSLVTPGAESADFEIVPHNQEGEEIFSYSPSPSVGHTPERQHSESSASEHLHTPTHTPHDPKQQEFLRICEAVTDKLAALPISQLAAENPTPQDDFVQSIETVVVAPEGAISEQPGAAAAEEVEVSHVITQEETGLAEGGVPVTAQESAEANLEAPHSLEALYEKSKELKQQVLEEGAKERAEETAVETEVKVPLSPEIPAIPEMTPAPEGRRPRENGRPNIDEKVNPPKGQELHPKHRNVAKAMHCSDPVQQVLGGAFKAGMTALEAAKSVLMQTSKAIQEANKHPNKQHRWEPPKQKWQPSSQAWIPQGTQTEQGEAAAASSQHNQATAWWTPPPNWSPEHPAISTDSGASASARAGEEPAEEEETSDVYIDIGEEPHSGYAPIPEAPGGQYEEEMNTLLSMGFCDVEKNLALLKENQADVTRVVDTLLMDFQIVRDHEVPPPIPEAPPETRTTQIVVPGSWGSAVHEAVKNEVDRIQHLSGAVITFNPEHESGADMHVGIKGIQEEIQMAQYLINQCITAAMSRTTMPV